MRHRVHVAIVGRELARKLLAGTKTVECRLYRTRRPPIDRVTAGDTILFKTSGGPLVASARAQCVLQVRVPRESSLRRLRDRLDASIAADEQFWRSRASARHGVFIWLSDVAELEPTRIDAPRQYGSGWVVLDDSKAKSLTRRLRSVPRLPCRRSIAE